MLVGNAQMPRADALPEPLKPLTRLQAVVLAEWRFGADAQGLIKQLKKSPPISRRLLQGLGAAAGLAAIGAAIWMFFLSDESTRTFTGHQGAVNSVAFSPDGDRALSGSHSDPTVRLWEVASGKQIHGFTGHTSGVSSVAFAPAGDRALSGSYDGTMRLWDVVTREQIRSFTVDYDTAKEIRDSRGRVLPSSFTDESVLSVAFAPDGRFALSGGGDATLRYWNISTGEMIRSFTGHGEAITSVAFASDGNRALSGSNDKTIRLWDIANGNEIRRFGWNTGPITSVAFAPDGKTALSGSKDGMLKLWKVADGTRRFTGHDDAITSVAFAPDGRRALSVGYSNGPLSLILRMSWLTLWDVENGKKIRTFTGNQGAAYSVTFAPDGRTALSGGLDGTLKLWEVEQHR